MSESDERTGLDPRSVNDTAGIEEEEPPGKPRRHPLWRSVPDHQWNDWRWQSQNAIRSVRQLRDLLPFTPDELDEGDAGQRLRGLLRDRAGEAHG